MALYNKASSLNEMCVGSVVRCFILNRMKNSRCAKVVNVLRKSLMNDVVTWFGEKSHLLT